MPPKSDGTKVGNQEYRLPDDRVAIHVRYSVTPGIGLDAYATHLTDRNEQSSGVAIRLLQARELLEWVERTSHPGNPVLIGGDFNDIPDSDTIRSLTAAGFIDLHAVAGNEPGFTNDRDDLDIEAPHANPNQRIDYVFFRPGSSRRFTIESVQLFLDRPSAEPGGRWLWASDHFGVLPGLCWADSCASSVARVCPGMLRAEGHAPARRTYKIDQLGDLG